MYALCLECVSDSVLSASCSQILMQVQSRHPETVLSIKKITRFRLYIDIVKIEFMKLFDVYVFV